MKIQGFKAISVSFYFLVLITVCLGVKRVEAQTPTFTVAVSPGSVAGGKTATGTITLSAASVSNTVFTLSSNNLSAATVPSTATVVAGSTTVTFPVTTASVASDTAVVISALSGGTTETSDLEVVLIGTWTDTTSSDDSLGTAILLTDGTVIAHSFNNYTNWFKLTPDASGNYADGTWSQITSNIIGRLYGETAILQNGDFFYGGGEYLSPGDNDNNTAEIYDPVANTWTQTPDSLYPSLGDTGSAILSNGTLLCSDWSDSNTDIYNPTTNTWSNASAMQNSTGDEETWMSMSDGSVLSVYDVGQRYIPSENIWQLTGALPNNLVDADGEIGPGAELYDGRTLIFGATGNTAFFTPPALVTGAGSWTAGPVMPDGLGAPDVPSCVEKNGKVLCTGCDGDYTTASFFEFDPNTNEFTAIPSPDGDSLVSYVCNMLALPNGQVLLTASSGNGWVYTPASGPQASWRPVVNSIIANVDGSYTVSGTQLNGLTNGASYGDDSNPYSAYPIASLVDGSGHVYYCRTYNFSQMNPSTVGGSQTANFTAPTDLPAGSYTFYITASGVKSAGVAFTPKYESTTAVTTSLNPAGYGQSVTFSATVTGSSPTGAIQFEVDGADLNSSVALSNDSASTTTTAITPGTHVITAIYTGDSNNTPSTGTLSPSEVVNKLPTTTTVTSSLNPSLFGNSVTFTANVSGTGSPTGTVTFLDTNASTGVQTTLGSATLSSDTASLTTSGLSVGTHDITAKYSGDGLNAASTGTLSPAQSVTLPTTTTSLISSLNPSTYGQGVTFTATVAPSGATSTGTPTGTVTFSVNGTAIATITLSSGVATFTTSALAAGSDDVTATYSGDTNFAGSSTTTALVQTVASLPSTVVVASSVNPSTFGQSVTFTAAASGSGVTPTGTVTFSIDGGAGTVVTLSGGKATLTTATLVAGTHNVTATYSGNTIYATSSTTAPFTQTVDRATSGITVKTSANPSVVGSSLTFTALVTGPGTTPTGSVTFLVNNVAETATITAGSATFTTSSLTAGTYPITASYSGDPNYNSSTTAAALSQVVNNPSSTTVVSSTPNPSTFGQTVTFTATVSSTASGTPTGSVIFSIDGVAQPSAPLSGGAASITDALLLAGSHSISASYSGDSNFEKSSTITPLTQTVNQAASATALSTSQGTTTYGQSVTFTATVTSTAGIPTGTVTFSIGGIPQPAVALVNGAATLTTSTLAGGTYAVVATYSGDSNFASSTSTSITQTVDALATTTTVTSTANPSTFGQSVTLTATVTSSSGTPTGTVSFSINGGAATVVTLVAGSASITTSSLPLGSNAVAVTYAGNSTFATSPGSLTQVVSQGAATVTLASSLNPAAVNTAVTFTATVTGPGTAPTGSVAFSIDGGTATNVTLVSGTATLSSSTLTVGPHTISATYNGDANYTVSSPAALTQTITNPDTTTTLSSGTNPSIYGNSVTFQATVAGPGGTPTGTVNFSVDGGTAVSEALSAGVASYVDTTLTAGSHSITATYGGDSNFVGSSATTPLTQIVNLAAASTSLGSSQNPSTFGEGVTFTATVAGSGGTPTGTVTFSVDGVAVTPASTIAAGQATYAAAGLLTGNHNITAVYSGDSNFAGDSTAPLAQVVNQGTSTTVTTSSANPSIIGQSVTFTATVSGPGTTPTGTVSFKIDGGTPVTVTLNAGVATLTTSTLSLGAHTVVAVYSGDTNYLGSTATTFSQQVNNLSTSISVRSSANPSVFDQSVTLTATVNGTGTATPTGSVTFTIDSATSSTAPLTGGAATLTTSALAIGPHTVTVTYAGDANNGGSTSPTFTQTVNPSATSTTLISTQSPSPFGSSVSFIATVTGIGGAPTGLVTFTIDGSTTSTVNLTSGSATLTTSSLSIGSHTVTAAYSGDANNAASTSTTLTQTIGPSPSRALLSSTANPSAWNSPVTFTAVVSGLQTTPTGTVTFYIDGILQNPVTLSAGSATLTTSTLTVGQHTVTASYGGDTNNAASSAAALTQQVSPAASTTTLTSSVNPSAFGQSVTFTAAVSGQDGAATGSVTFSIDGTAEPASALTSGTATFTTASLSPGSHAVTATYSGNTNYASSSSTALTQTTGLASSTTTLSSSANPSGFGQSVIYTAAVTGQDGAATGTVTFTVDGTVQFPPVALVSGSASYTTASLSSGSHTVTASYSGDTNYASSSSTALTQTVGLAPSATTLNSSANPSAFGQSVTFTAAVSGQGGAATGTVTFTVDGTAQSPVTLISGSASFTTSSLSPGSHTVTASYSGDASLAASTAASLTQTVDTASSTTTLSSTPNPSTFGEAVTLTAVVAGTGGVPTGTVTFTVDGAAAPAAALSAGSASYSLATLTPGSHTVTASYSGNTNFAASSASAITQTVSPYAPAPSISPSGGVFTSVQTVTLADTATGATIYYTTNGSAPTTSSAKYTAPFTVSASEKVTAIATAPGYSTSPSASASFTINLPVLASFGSGLQLISLPYSFPGDSLDSIFGYTGVKLAVWESSADAYSVTPVAPADSIVTGQGYWVRFPQAVSVTTPGTPAPTNTPFVITLQAGWNMIGDPFTTSVPLSSLTFKGGTETFAQATASPNPLIAAEIYAYPAGSTTYTAATSLQPDQGYWIYATEATTLEVPSP